MAKILILGKRRMNSIMSQETGIPYRDVAVYGRYTRIGDLEKLEIGAYTMNSLKGEITLYEPEYSGMLPEYISRKIDWKEGNLEE